MKTTLCRMGLALGLLAGWGGGATLQAAVRVYGLASSSGQRITTRVYADISIIPVVSCSFKVFYDDRVLTVVQAARNDAVWSLFDGVGAVAYQQPEVSRPGEVWFLCGKLDAGGPQSGVLGTDIPLGTVIFDRQSSRIPEFNLVIGRPGDYANFVTTHGLALEALPGEVTFDGVAPPRNDVDLDGLDDKWETEFFKDPQYAYYSDDSDKDGMDNLSEQAAGSDPTDPSSNLRMSLDHKPGSLLLQWTSFAGRSYTLQGSDDLRRFRSIKTGIVATPPWNEFELTPGGSCVFYRVVLETAEE